MGVEGNRFDASKIGHIEGQDELAGKKFGYDGTARMEKAREMAEKMDYYHDVATEFKAYLANPTEFSKQKGPKRSAEYKALADAGVPPEYIVKIGELKGEAVGALYDYQRELGGRKDVDIVADKVLFTARGIALALKAAKQVDKTGGNFIQSPEAILLEQNRVLWSRMSDMASEELGQRRREIKSAETSNNARFLEDRARDLRREADSLERKATALRRDARASNDERYGADSREQASAKRARSV